jgi:hypothetical protein
VLKCPAENIGSLLSPFVKRLDQVINVGGKQAKFQGEQGRQEYLPLWKTTSRLKSSAGGPILPLTDHQKYTQSTLRTRSSLTQNCRRRQIVELLGLVDMGKILVFDVKNEEF